MGILLKDSYEYLKERFKGQEIVSAVIHMDETKPHLDITFSYFNKELGKWNQRNLMQQKKTDLNKLLKDFEEKVGKKYGLTKGKGQELDKPLRKAFAKAVEEKIVVENALPRREKVIDTKKAVKVIKELDNEVKKIIKNAEYYKKIENEYKKIKREKENLLKEKIELENRLKNLEQVTLKLKQQNSKLLKENQSLKQENIILVKNYKQALKAAAQERHLRLNKQVNYKMIDRTIKKIKKDYESKLKENNKIEKTKIYTPKLGTLKKN